MRKREKIAWVSCVICIGITLTSLINIPITIRMENIELENQGRELFDVKLHYSKALSMLQTPIPIDPATENVTINNFEIDLTGQVPPGVNRTLVEAENRTLSAFLNNLTVHLYFVNPSSINITIGAHVATNSGAIQLFNFTSKSFTNTIDFGPLMLLSKISNVESILSFDYTASVHVELRKVLWVVTGEYPIIVQFFIIVEGDMLQVGDHVSNMVETEYYRIDAP